MDGGVEAGLDEESLLDGRENDSGYSIVVGRHMLPLRKLGCYKRGRAYLDTQGPECYI